MDTTTDKKPDFTVLPAKKEYLQFTIGSRCRAEFAYNPYTVLPKVEFFTAEEMAKKGISNALGWFDFRTSKIGVVVGENDPKTDWIRATGVTVHEHLHWLWTWSPIDLGLDITSEPEMKVFNIFEDPFIEIRACVESPWARRILRRTRTNLWQNANPRVFQDELYPAIYLTLGLYTFLSSQGQRILKKLYHEPENARAAASKVWNAAKVRFTGSVEQKDEQQWLSALGIALEAWVAPSDLKRVELTREFISMFPPPAGQQPPPDDLELGEHVNQGRPRQDAPQGTTPGKGSPSPITKPDKKGKGAGDKSAKPATDENPDSDKSDDANGSGKKDEGSADDGNFRLDDTGNPADQDKQDEDFYSDAADSPDQVAREMKENNKRCEESIRGLVTRQAFDFVDPIHPAALFKPVESDAQILASYLKIVQRPQYYGGEATRGKLNVRRISRNENHDRPFRNRLASDLGTDEQAFIAFASDNSDSMNRLRKTKAIAAAQGGLMVQAACHQTNTRYLITNSRAMLELASSEMSYPRGQSLIAGLQNHCNSGDSYIDTLPKIINLVKNRREKVKILIVLTDGQPGGIPTLKTYIDKARSEGVIIVGLGLEIRRAQDVTGMQTLFGVRPDQLCLTSVENLAKDLGTCITAAIRRGRRQFA